jgi:hypothetical protein
MRPRLSLLLLLALCASCSASRATLGQIQLERPSDRQFARIEYTVQQGRVMSQDLDLSEQENGCLSGTFISAPLELCPAGTAEVLRAQRWTGSGGDFLVEVIEGATAVRAAGQLWPGGVRPGIPVHVTVPLGAGPQWDELKRKPALLAVAAAVAGVRSGPRRDPQRVLRPRTNPQRRP